MHLLVCQCTHIHVYTSSNVVNIRNFCAGQAEQAEEDVQPPQPKFRRVSEPGPVIIDDPGTAILQPTAKPVAKKKQLTPTQPAYPPPRSIWD